MSQPTEGSAVSRRWLAAINAHDLDAIADCFTADYRDEAPARRGEHVDGREQVRANFERLLTDVRDVIAVEAGLVVDGHIEWLEWRMHGTRDDGTALDFVGVNVFEIENGRFRSGRIYTELVRDAGGLEEQLDRMAGGTG